MNIFRLSADLLHLASVIILLLRIRNTQSCKGISLKTQGLYLLVFVTRYIDLFLVFISVYNTVMKIFFIVSAAGVLYYMMYHPIISKGYNRAQDSFRVEFLLVPCFLLASFVNEVHASFSGPEKAVEILWTFSIYLEAVAILPQLFMIQRRQERESFTWHYVAALGGYRALYLVNWIYRFITEPYYRNWIVWISGIIQTGLYADFFYYYVKALQTGNLPV